jgi:hypothetical protein
MLVDQERLEPTAVAGGVKRFVTVAQQSSDSVGLV